MKRPWAVWSAFAVSVALLLAVMGWFSGLVVQLDRQGKAALAEAAFQENVRLALWRMDSALASLVGLENARPSSSYGALFRLEREALARPPAPDEPETGSSPFVLLHFEIDAEGRPISALTLKEEDDESWRPDDAKGEKLAGMSGRLAALRTILAERAPAALIAYDENRRRVMNVRRAAPSSNDERVAEVERRETRIPLHQESADSHVPAEPAALPAASTRNIVGPDTLASELSGAARETIIPLHPESQALQSRADQEVQQQLNVNELMARQLVSESNIQMMNKADLQQTNQWSSPPETATTTAETTAASTGEAEPEAANQAVAGQKSEKRRTATTIRQVVEDQRKMRVELLRPCWVDNDLFLVRGVADERSAWIQGALLDWSALEIMLLDLVRDLLPRAVLQAAVADTENDRAHLLAALPIRLSPGPTPTVPGSLDPLLRLSLGIAWGCVLLAALAVGLVLGGAISLGNRRGAFVSAVTHELRTPLTTFRMYTEMLNAGMVTQEEKRRHYLATLHREAERLGNLVENVLSYAQLEKKKNQKTLGSFTPADLLDRFRDRLSDRARQAGLHLVVEVAAEAQNRHIRADISAVERILFNLVDNAAKYSANPTKPEIRLSVAEAPRRVVIRVRDYGPGIRADFRGKLFKAFSKSAEEAAGSAPGVGLGLNICRRLARQMGGDLVFDRHVLDGAGFRLSLPVVR